MIDKLKEWEWYENGKSYNRKLEPSFYDLVDTNWDFFYGKQWRNAGLDDSLPQPVFNNINRFVTFFVASILSNRVGVNFHSPVGSADELVQAADMVVNKSWQEFAERIKFDYQIKNALYDGAVTGDYVGHMFLDPNAKPYGGAFSDVIGQIDFELVDPNNFYVANPNSRDLQKQKYIIIYGRDLVSNLKAEKELQDTEVQPDNDTEEQAGFYGDIEMEGDDADKAGYIYVYQKNEDGMVICSKLTQGTYIYKDKELGFTRYPVAHANWELQRNTYHGMSFVTSAIPTQIFINRGFAMAMTHVMNSAFPIRIFDKNRISGFSNKVNSQIGVDIKPGESVNNLAGTIAPTNMSTDVINMIDLAQTFMKDTVGAGDALLGNINPEQASGVSISVASKQAGVPLENPKANLYNWVEDIALNYLDMISHLYGERPVVVPNDMGGIVEEFDFDTLQDNYRTVKIDIGATSYWSEIAVVQTLDNLLDRQLIEFIDYLERMPDGYVTDKEGLIVKIKQQQQAQAQQQSQDQQIMQQIMSQLTPQEQQAFMQLPPEQQQAQIAQYMSEIQ